MCLVSALPLWLCLQPGNVVRANAGAKALAAETFHIRRQGLQVGVVVSIVQRPLPSMLFRPEEIHAASTPGPILGWPADFTTTVSDDRLRIGAEDAPVPDLNSHRVAAIETRGRNVDRFTREEPADCQRFEASLGKPLVLPADRDAILRWQVVERSKGHDIVGIRMHPGRNAGMD